MIFQKKEDDNKDTEQNLVKKTVRLWIDFYIIYGSYLKL